MVQHLPGSVLRLLEQAQARTIPGIRRSSHAPVNMVASTRAWRSQVSHSSEEVLALKRFIQRCAQDQERLKEIIVQNKERDEFMFNHR